MVSFTDYYNAISIDRVLSKIKIGKGSWCFNNSLLWRMLRYYLKLLHSRKYYNLKTEFTFFVKNTTPQKKKNPTLQQVNDGKIPNLVLKRMLEIFLNIPSLKKVLEFQNWKKTAKLTQKNFKPEIKSMIEKLQDELYQLENKQAKGAKLCANIR